MPRRTIQGSRAIVTGASSGIGRAVAAELYRQGAEVVVTARREERLQELIDEIGKPTRKMIAVAGDVTDRTLRQRLLETAIQELGGLDILINNAGIGGVGPFAEAEEDRLRKIMEVNFFAPLELIRLAIPELRHSAKPIITNVGSVLGHFAVPKKSEYCASKFALHGFTDALREELAVEGIDVLLVSPSTTESEFFQRVIDRPPGKAPPWGPFRMSPEKVARRTVRAIRGGRREIILSASGKLGVWMDRFFPGLLSWILSRQDR